MEKRIKTLGRSIGNFFSSNWVTGVIALFCAMVLWGFVLTSQNPERTKTLIGIPLSFEGEADLIARKLVVYGDREEILPDVTVRVNTDLLSYADLTASDITATVSLRNISETGQHTLNIRATSANGTVLSVTPATIVVDIDRLTTKRIPIEITTIGQEDNTYWYSEPFLSRDEIEIEGALSALADIKRAVGEVNIDARTATFTDAVTLKLFDSDDNEIDTATLYGEVPSVAVSVEILPKKLVPFDLEGALTGVDQLPANYEIASMLTVPSSVMIVAEESILDDIESLELSNLDVLNLLDRINNSDNDDTIGQPVELNIIIPEGVRIIGDWSTVDAYVNIREKIVEKTFVDVPVTIINRDSDLSYSIVMNRMDITITGKISLLNNIEEADLELYIDVANLGVGTHTVTVNVDLQDHDLLMEIAYKLESNEISVVITGG